MSESVPPVKILNPSVLSVSDKILALATTFFAYILKSSERASLKQSLLQQLHASKDLPVTQGNTAVLNFFAKSSC